MAEGKGEQEAQDYMGDLSLFLPPQSSSLPSLSSKKNSNTSKAPNPQPFKKQKKVTNKNLNWQERRNIERQRKQREEDEQTLAKCESAIPASNIGFKLLQQMGFKPGSALGKDGSGRAEPVGIEIRRSRAGLGKESPAKEKTRREEARAESIRRREMDLMVDFGSRQKMQWRLRRIANDYEKAIKVLAQLENEEVLVVEGGGEEDGGEKEDDDEEEEITEEDLQDMLMKLRNGHHYCLYCGCQYESMAALSSNCPGPSEEDH